MDNKLNKLQELSELFQSGVIDKAEFDKLKRELLNDSESTKEDNQKPTIEPLHEIKLESDNESVQHIGGFNIIDQFTLLLINAPHYLLLMIAIHILWMSSFGTCCCINPIAGYDMQNDLIGFLTNSDNFLYIATVIVPFILGVILSFRMIYQMVFNVKYPNGANPFGFLPLISLFLFGVATYSYLMSLGFIG
jgi:hypothetical protein